MTVAIPSRHGWTLTPPEPAGPPESLFARMTTRAGGAPVALGIDCPIGVPRAYAQAHLTAPDFPAFLRGLAEHPAFFRVAATLDQISAATPFYPARGIAGMTRAAHAAALGLGSANGLNRLCDQATASRPAGAPVFWTLGANQSGKAAIAAWRDLLLPAMLGPDPPRLWPFAGALNTLLAQGGITVAETYPAEAMRHVGLRPAGSKRRQADRAAYATALLDAMKRLHATPSAALRQNIKDGFAPSEAGEDQFDSLLGVLCVLGVVQGQRPDTAPADPWVQTWEGWVLGQTDLPKA